MIPTPYTLYDDFAYKGQWWLRGGRSWKASGELIVKAGDEIRLDIYGGFRRGKASTPPLSGGGNPAVIHGMTDAGEVTLFDNLFSTGHHSSKGNVYTSYRSNLCVFGAWFDGLHDVRFTNLTLRYTHLEWWFAAQPFGRQDHSADGKPTGVTLTYTFPPPIRADLSGRKMAVAIEPEVNEQHSHLSSAQLTHQINVRVTPGRRMSIDYAFGFVSDFQKWLTLLVGEQVFVRSFRGTVAAREVIDRKTRATRKMRAPCAVIFSQLEQRPADKARSHQMIYPADVLGERTAPVLLKWFDSLETLRPVYEVFFSTFHTSRMFIQSRFLHLSQALESFHRRTVGGVYEPDPAKYAAIEATMTKAIPAGIGNGLRQRLKSQVHYANEPSLRKRLTGILKGLAADESAMIYEEMNELVNSVVGTRNYLTHLDESSGDHRPRRTPTLRRHPEAGTPRHDPPAEAPRTSRGGGP